jgi:hypothetical protein
MTTNNQQFLPDFFPCPSVLDDAGIEAAIVMTRESALDGFRKGRAEAFYEGVLFERRMSVVMSAHVATS